MAFDPKHLKWIKNRKTCALFEFIKPQKELKPRPPKVRRIKQRIKSMQDTDIEE